MVEVNSSIHIIKTQYNFIYIRQYFDLYFSEFDKVLFTLIFADLRATPAATGPAAYQRTHNPGTVRRLKRQRRYALLPFNKLSEKLVRFLSAVFSD